MILLKDSLKFFFFSEIDICHKSSLITIWFWSFVTIWVLSHFEFCHNLRFVTVWVLSEFDFCHNLSYVTIWVFEYHHKLSFWVSSQFEFLSFITIWVFELHHYLSSWVSSQFKFLSFITIQVCEFHNNLISWVSLQFEFLSYHILSFWVSSQLNPKATGGGPNGLTFKFEW